MALLNFGKSKFSTLSDSFSTHEQNAKDSLFVKHPHSAGLLSKHDVDLRQIRHKGKKAVAAATILGGFLAFPHLLGHGTATEKTADPGIQTLNIEKQVEPNQNPTNPHQANGTQANPTIAVNQGNALSNTGSTSIDDDKHKSQGHIHGRSYLAPPKDHGYHDLGLHKGEDNGNGKAEAPGPHPEDLGINHQQGGPK